jgi:hypothetical protein
LNRYGLGVLFLTYATLVSKTKTQTRLDQIIDWFIGGGEDGAVGLYTLESS